MNLIPSGSLVVKVGLAKANKMYLAQVGIARVFANGRKGAK